MGKTEVIFDEPNPIFAKQFTVHYLFEKNQTIRCEVWEFDEGKDDELIGEFSTQINKILTAHK